MLLKKPVEEDHDKQTDETAADAVEQADSLAEEQGGEQNAGSENKRSLFGGVALQKDQGDNISQSRLDARYGNKRGNGTFNGVDSQRYGCKKCQCGKLAGRHTVSFLNKSGSVLLLRWDAP